MKLRLPDFWSGLNLLILAGLTVATIVIVLAWSGLYNVAASGSHLPGVEPMLRFAMSNSVRTRATLGAAAPKFTDAQARLGAAHFHINCAQCHGGPSVRRDPTYQHTLPPPPALSDHVKRWDDRSLYWIVRHGLKYTSMPAWPASGSGEIWSVVAFLRRLPDLDAEGYRRLAYGNSASTESGTTMLPGTKEPNLGFCARCHGDRRHPPATRLAPILAGQKRQYLKSALEDYANGSRASGIMISIASALREDKVVELAKEYSEVRRPASSHSSTEPQKGDRRTGQTIVAQGLTRAGVPKCMSCHGEQGAPNFPRLDGQPAEYIRAQLLAFQDGLRSGTPNGQMMTDVAKRLTTQNVDDLAAYYASLTPFSQAGPGGAQQ